MNLLDRVIMGVAPVSGLRRIRARAAASAVMNYDAASKGRRTYGWKAPAGSGDAAAFGSLGRLRQLSRDMIRNRALAARAQQVIVGNVVGSGIVPSVVSDSKEVRDRVDAVIRDILRTTAIDAQREHNIFGLQRIAMSAVFSDGEVLVRRRMRNRAIEPDLTLGFQVELLEADHLDPVKTRHGQNDVVDGVEFGPTGRVEAYHLYDRHPGDITRIGRGAPASSRVDARNVLHIRRVDRPGQVRGVPWLAPVMMTLGEISDYQEAQILKQRMAALLAAFIETDDDGKEPDLGGLSELAPGAMVALKAGQSAKFTDPPKVETYEDFMRQAVAMIAVGIGSTYEALSGDLRQVNFSSARMGRMEMDRLIEVAQQEIMIAQFCAGVGRWFREGWVLSPETRKTPLSAWSLDWTAPRRALIDPTREIPAMIEEVEGGLTSLQRQQRRLGYDPATIRREREEDAPHAPPPMGPRQRDTSQETDP